MNAKAPRFGAHSFRHFYASMLIEQGLNPKKVQALEATMSPAEGHLMALGFRALPAADRGEDELDVVKGALRRPIVGDAAFLSWYTGPHR
jgi:hypothetical protein